ncbi:MAG TPA: phosphatase PAP2 family protein [Burkholderiaceae bacterium]|jgi:undecaprenyl-diphosphatase|nr:phosphatase PAP2 family protein [Burkholderiaceae bacterium]
MPVGWGSSAFAEAPSFAKATEGKPADKAAFGSQWCAVAALAAIAVLLWTPARAGGFLGIDHRWSYDDSGVWKRSNQLILMDSLIGGEILCGLWEGGATRIGNTCWRAIDSSLIAGASAQILKYVFTRARPRQGNDPNAWFQGGSHYSFPSGEVAAVSSIVTPFILAYRSDQPAVWALEALPLYDGIARMKVQAHWQTDVLAGFAIGTAAGYYAWRRENPFVVGLMPHGIYVGLKHQL